MKRIIDLAQVYNTNTVSRQYLIPWISEKLGIHDNYVIVHCDIIHKPLSVINRFDTIILDALKRQTAEEAPNTDAFPSKKPAETRRGNPDRRGRHGRGQ